MLRRQQLINAFLYIFHSVCWHLTFEGSKTFVRTPVWISTHQYFPGVCKIILNIIQIILEYTDILRDSQKLESFLKFRIIFRCGFKKNSEWRMIFRFWFVPKKLSLLHTICHNHIVQGKQCVIVIYSKKKR